MISIYNAAEKYRKEILAKVEKSKGVNKCWEWTGRKTKKGYGRYGVYRSSAFYAHRLVYVLFGNGIPKGMVLDHICKNRICVNPAHLYVVTLRQNVLENSDSTPAKNRKKTHCLNGHSLSEAKIYSGRSGRKCLICQRARDRKRFAEGKSAEDFFKHL